MSNTYAQRPGTAALPANATLDPFQAIRADAGGMTARLRDAAPQHARTIAITGGKGGVGKTNMAVALALCAARAGKRVGILDADFGLAKLHILLGLTPQADLRDVLSGDARLADTLIEGPGGIRILPGPSGLAEIANLNREQRQMLLTGLEEISTAFDILLVDTGAGINENVLTFVVASDEAVVVTTPEPTALADAYGLIKVTYDRRKDLPFHLLVNNAATPTEADSAARRLADVSQRFLNISIAYAGRVPADTTVGTAVRARRSFLAHMPDSPASMAIAPIATRILGIDDISQPRSAPLAPQPTSTPNGSTVMPAPQTFVQRLSSLIGLGRRS